MFTAFIAVAALRSCAPVQELRPMSADDVLRIVRLEDVAMSPDGERVLYTERRLDWDENEYAQRHLLVPFGGGEAQEFVGAAGGEDFAFSPDGRWLSFLREVDDDDQLFLMPVAGGEGIQLTKHRGGVGAHRWTADSTRVFFVAEEPRTKAEQAKWDS